MSTHMSMHVRSLVSMHMPRSDDGVTEPLTHIGCGAQRHLAHVHVSIPTHGCRQAGTVRCGGGAESDEALAQGLVVGEGLQLVVAAYEDAVDEHLPKYLEMSASIDIFDDDEH